ncbi:hypothetical protein FHR55_001114 [Xanthomonas arboricola]
MTALRSAQRKQYGTLRPAKEVRHVTAATLLRVMQQIAYRCRSKADLQRCNAIDQGMMRSARSRVNSSKNEARLS